MWSSPRPERACRKSVAASIRRLRVWPAALGFIGTLSQACSQLCLQTGVTSGCPVIRPELPGIRVRQRHISLAVATTLSSWGDFQQFSAIKAIESSGVLERAMGIEADTRSAVLLNDIVDDQRLTNPVVTRAAEIQRPRTGSLTLSAPFCPRVKFLSVHPSGRWLVGAVGIEFAVNPISPVDSIALAPLLPLEMQLRSRVLWPRCGQLSRAGGIFHDA